MSRAQHVYMFMLYNNNFIKENTMKMEKFAFGDVKIYQKKKFIKSSLNNSFPFVIILSKNEISLLAKTS